MNLSFFYKRLLASGSDYLRTAVLIVYRWLVGSEPRSYNHHNYVRSVLRVFFLGQDTLMPLSIAFQSNGYHGDLTIFKSLFSDTILGTWAIDQAGIDVIWKTLEKIKPKVIVEFGSGSSTLVFASWLKQRNASDNSCISIEQDEREAEATRSRLVKHGLSKYVFVIVAPVNKDGCYELPDDKIREIIAQRKVDFVFIDGPSGPTGCRINTREVILPYLEKQCYWLLHDALRDGEMSIVKQWGDVQGRCYGICPVGQGIAFGRWGN
jgi:hypothetical protein